MRRVHVRDIRVVGLLSGQEGHAGRAAEGGCREMVGVGCPLVNDMLLETWHITDGVKKKVLIVYKEKDDIWLGCAGGHASRREQRQRKTTQGCHVEESALKLISYERILSIGSYTYSRSTPTGMNSYSNSLLGDPSAPSGEHKAESPTRAPGMMA